MAKRADSVVGIDLGKHVLKGVALRRKGDSRFILTSFASRPVPEDFASAEDLSRELKQLLRELGGSAKACAFAVSPERIAIERARGLESGMQRLRARRRAGCRSRG